ncbi:MAG: sel1 repeat family protein [Clostridium sp.]|nr:sel1 repeat family protein [Clostridium sp.]
MENVRVVITYSDVDGLISITVDGNRLDISAIKGKDIDEWFEESDGRDGWNGLITEIKNDIASDNKRVNFEFNGPKEDADKFNNNLERYGYENCQKMDDKTIYETILTDAKMLENRGYMEKALDKYKKAADGGKIAEAQFWMAEYYKNEFLNIRWDEDEKGKSDLIDKMLVYYEKAADQNYIDAQRSLAELYEVGDIIGENEEEAFKWNYRMAELNDIPAQIKVGDYYKKRGEAGDYEKAEEYYKRATEAESLKAENKWGLMYLRGGVWEKSASENERAEAIKKIIHSAEKGFDKAQFNLGRFYLYGENGFSVDYQEAYRWLEKSAEQENRNAQYMLAYMYDLGLGVEQNYEEEYKWLEKSAEQENEAAQYMLAHMYYYGKGMEENYQEAFKWYSKSAEKGNSDAQNSLGDMYYYGKGIEKNYQEAFKWYSESAEKGNSDAQYNLGYMYDYGVGVEKNYLEAFKWYSESAEKGNNNATNSLGDMYYYGKGMEKNYQKALEEYKVAADNGSANGCYKIAEYFYSLIDNHGNIDTAAFLAVGFLIPVTNLITITAGVVGRMIEKKVKFKKFLKTDVGKEMLKYYQRGAEYGDDKCIDRIKELEKYK